MTTDASKKLEYLCAVKDQFLVITFLGSLTEENASVLDRLLAEIPKLEAKCCVLQFRDTVGLNRSMIPRLIQLQEKIRETIGKIRLCSLKPAFKEWLSRENVIRSEEMVDNLLEAWQEFRRRN